jgi:hypothetical protein
LKDAGCACACDSPTCTAVLGDNEKAVTDPASRLADPVNQSSFLNIVVSRYVDLWLLYFSILERWPMGWICSM